MRNHQKVHRREALGVLKGGGREPLLDAVARASFRLRLLRAFEGMLRWSWAHAGAWAVFALVWRTGAPWAVFGCGLSLGLSFAAFVALTRADGLDAARAIDKASRLDELVSTAVECASGGIESRFSPLVIARAERTRERGAWRLPRPRPPAQARYAAVPGALLVLLAVLPAGSGSRGPERSELTAEEVFGSGGEEALARAGSERRRMAGAALRARRLRAVRPEQRSRPRGRSGRPSPGEGGKVSSPSEKGTGKPGRAYGPSSPPERAAGLPGGGEWTSQEEVNLAALLDAYPRYAGVIRRYFEGGR